MEQFRKLGISEQILKSIQEHKFEKPTEIQEKTIQLVLDGKDVIARASTGSGKTLAFGSAIIQNSKKDFGIQALVLTPTRELAEQISTALKRFSKYNSLNIIPIYGGVSINPQIEDLESAEVVIGTPGRILDHLQRQTLNLKHLKTLVLDEADRMLDMGFIDDVEKIISQCPRQRQTLLFSATISQDIVRLSNKYMRNQIEISAEEYVDPTKLTQVYYDVDDRLKYSLFKHLIENENAKLVMVFCNTRKNVDFVSNNLNSMGIEALPIHGGFSQDKRNKIMEQFHSQKVHVLVCTDVAARGLDIKSVSHIYNYDMPKEAKEYIHRIGRTARAGEEGKVINIVSSRDYENFRNVLKNDEIKITCEKTPDVQPIRIHWMPKRRDDRGSMNRFRNQRFNHQRQNRTENRYGNRDNRNNNRTTSRYGNRDNRSRDDGRNRDDGRPHHSRDHDKHKRNDNRSRYGSRNRRY